MEHQPNIPNHEMCLLTPASCPFACSCVHAQDHYAGLDFVQGPVYVVYDHPLGPIVYWEDEPASVAQIKTTEDGVIEVSPPGVDAPRLLIYLEADDRLAKVVDLEYQRDPRLPNEQAYNKSKATESPIEITFRNGLYFTYADGIASATYLGETVPVAGSEGRYRIETADFEAGIAFGPMWNGKVYQYLREK